jgi:nucleoside-diphosphate-sugar epimerase
LSQEKAMMCKLRFLEFFCLDKFVNLVGKDNISSYGVLTSICRLTKSDFQEPLNIGSDEMVSMNEMAEIVLSFENKKLPIEHIPGPEGVRGRNSDNTLIKEKLGWAPSMRLKVCDCILCF